VASVASDGGARGSIGAFRVSLKDDATLPVPPTFVVLYGRGLRGEEDDPHLRIVVASVAGDGRERGSVGAFRVSLKDDATAPVPPTLVVLDGRGFGGDKDDPRLRIVVASVAGDGSERGSVGAFRVSLKDDATAPVPPAFVVFDGRGLGGEEKDPRLRIVMASVAGDGGLRAFLKDDATGSVPPAFVVLDGRGLGGKKIDPAHSIVVKEAALDASC